jgi:hypothetical protein
MKSVLDDRRFNMKEIKRMDEIKPGRYRHFKGNEYKVLHIARHSETLEEMVVYQALYGAYGIWVRPASMWNEMVEFEGKIVRRFEYIGED